MTGIAADWRTETIRVGRRLEVLEGDGVDMDEKLIKCHKLKTSSPSGDSKKV
jgi:hypothetical protein